VAWEGRSREAPPIPINAHPDAHSRRELIPIAMAPGANGSPIL
jgi:hypothetical protein